MSTSDSSSEPQSDRLDITVGDDDGESHHSANRSATRSWIGIHFECCGVYARIYRSADKQCYSGCCPRCNRPLRVPVGSDGTSQRIFRAS